MLELILGGAVVLIIALALCNPRFWRDLKRGHSSMDDVLQEGREDLKAACKSRKKKEE